MTIRDPGSQPLEAHKLRLLAEQMPAIAWTVDTNDRCTSVVGGGLEQLGYEATSVDVLLREAMRGTDALEATLLAHHRALAGEVSRYSATWDDRTFECCVEPLREGGRIAGSVGAAVDVTERHRGDAAIRRAYEEGVECLVRAIESRDIVTGQHVDRMSAYCKTLAQAVGLDFATCQAIAVAARLHDVGKIGIPDAVLLRDGPLSDPERAVIERHCQVGYAILAGAQSEILQLAAEIALAHHEWYDGTGYPQGLVGESIPLVGRIAAIADVFDALTSPRPYRVAWPIERAEEAMLAEEGTHFDPELLRLFFELDLEAGLTDSAP